MTMVFVLVAMAVCAATEFRFDRRMVYAMI
jgi:hypothetical protein